jgi:hypothetical protein
MNFEIENLVESGKLSLPEIIDFIQVFKKFVDVGIFPIKRFESYLEILGIEWDGNNTFKVSEDTVYIFT